MSKIIPKDATLYCPNCMIETKVVEGQIEPHTHNIPIPIFCSVCKKQISELIWNDEFPNWRLNLRFYQTKGDF